MYIFSFRSRTQSMKFYDSLRAEKISCNIINTPRQVTGVCGLSVSIGDSNLAAAKKVFASSAYDTFFGIYEMK